MSGRLNRLIIEAGQRERELWRRQYHTRPYLEDASDAELADRFRTIMQNMTTLTVTGEIGVLPREPHGKRWYRLYAELEEAYRRRGFVLTGPRLPCPAYPTAPRALAALGHITVPEAGTYLVKYGQRKHMIDLYVKGQVMVKPATSYHDPSLNLAIRDDELEVTGIALRSEVVIGIPDRNTGKPILEAHPLSNIVLTSRSIKNYFVYCLSSVFDVRLFDDFGYDACVILADPAEFIQRIQHAVDHHCKGWLTDHQSVRYIDPYNWKKAIKEDVFFTKDVQYWYQHEYRIVWIPSMDYDRILEPLHLEIGSLDGKAQLILL
jgi:hypothetical protein